MLSKKAQYSILALVKLAREYENGPVLISSIAMCLYILLAFLRRLIELAAPEAPTKG